MRRSSLRPFFIGAVLLTVVVLLFMQLRHVRSLDQRHSEVVDLLAHLGVLEESFAKELLLIRYSRHHDFDAIRAIHRATNKAIIRLRGQVRGVFVEDYPKFAYLIQQYEGQVAGKWILVEHFLADAALLKNSLSFFYLDIPEQLRPLLSQRQLRTQAARDLIERLSQMERDILAFEGGRSQGPMQQLEQQRRYLETEAEQWPSAVQKLLRRVTTHARLLVENKLAVDGLMDKLAQVPTASTLEEMNQGYWRRHQALEQQSNLIVGTLFLTTVLLLGYFVVIAARLDRNARALMHQREEAQVTLNSMGEGVITTDEQAQVTYINQSAAKLLQTDPPLGSGVRLEDLVHLSSDITGAQLEDPARQVLRNNAPLSLEDHIVMRNVRGHEAFVAVTAAPMKDRGDKTIGSVVILRDVSSEYELARRLTDEMQFDSLTKLLRRDAFERRIVEAMGSARQQGQIHALCYLNLDHFKVVNDSCGTQGGDRLLSYVGGLIQREVFVNDVAARIGADEFAVLFLNRTPQEGLDMACRIQAAIAEAGFTYGSFQFDIGASIGLVYVTGAEESVADILSAGRVALEMAKSSGRNRVAIYDENDMELREKQSEMLWVPLLRKALDENRFSLYLQPITPLQQPAPKMQKFEVLLRLQDDGGELIMPGQFIPAAEKYNFMLHLDRWVIHRVFQQTAEEVTAGECNRQYAINLSGESLGDTYLLDYVRELQRQFAIEPSCICFEITETATIANFANAMYLVGQLRQMGFLFAIDDFGTGLSSFSYIKDIEADYLKIDGSFVREMLDNRVAYAIVESVQRIGREKNAQIVAEFVENEAIHTELRRLGVDFAQGYWVGRPAPWKEQG